MTEIIWRADAEGNRVLVIPSERPLSCYLARRARPREHEF